jgi:hypothetical protein
MAEIFERACIIRHYTIRSANPSPGDNASIVWQGISSVSPTQGSLNVFDSSAECPAQLFAPSMLRGGGGSKKSPRARTANTSTFDLYPQTYMENVVRWRSFGGPWGIGEVVEKLYRSLIGRLTGLFTIKGKKPKED